MKAYRLVLMMVMSACGPNTATDSTLQGDSETFTFGISNGQIHTFTKKTIRKVEHFRDGQSLTTNKSVSGDQLIWYTDAKGSVAGDKVTMKATNQSGKVLTRNLVVTKNNGRLIIVSDQQPLDYKKAIKQPKLKVKPQPQIDQRSMRLLATHNRVRAQRGLRPLRINHTLMRAAQMRAEINARFNVRRAGKRWSKPPHGDPRIGMAKSSTVTKQLGYQGTQTWRENYFWNVSSPEQCVSGWMGSPGHAVQVVSPQVNEVGFGYATSPVGSQWIAIYGRSN